MLLNCGVGEDSWVPWTARRSNQSILKEISPGISLEAMMLKLKLQYFGHLMQRVDSLEKTLMLGGIGSRRRRGRPRMRWLDGITDGRESEWTPGDGDGQGGLAWCDTWGRKESDTTERLNWTELRQHIKKQRHYFADGPSSQSYSFSSSHVWMWELDHKEGWALKNWCFWTVVLEKTLKSPLNCKEIKPVNPKGNQSWIFIGRTDAEAEAPILWPPDARSRLIGKDPDAEKIGGRRRRGWQRVRRLDDITDSMDMSLRKLLEVVKDREAWCAAAHGFTKSHDWVTEQQ